MADVSKLRGYIETLGVAVRAGLITPSMDDEIYLRKYFELPEMNSDVKAEWAAIGGTRGPITIAKETAQAPADVGAATTEQGADNAAANAN